MGRLGGGNAGPGLGWGGWKVSRCGAVDSGRGLWLGWAPTFSHPLGIGGGAIVGMGAGHWSLLTQLVSTAPCSCTRLEGQDGVEGRRGMS